MYYNDAIKQEYLDGKNTKSGIQTVFNKAKPWEEKYGQDIAEMEQEAIITFLNESCSLGLATARMFVVYLRTYINWYRTKFPKEYSSIDKVNIPHLDFSSRMREQYVPTLNDLIGEFEFYDFDQGDQVAPLIMLCWLGFPVRESCQIFESQIDLKNGIIFGKDGYVLVRDIPPEILSIFRRYKAVKEAKIQRGQLETWHVIDSQYFIRYMKPLNARRDDTGKPYDVTYYTYANKKVKDEYEAKTGKKSKLVTSDVYWSGMLYRLHQFISSGADLSNRESQYKVRSIMRVNTQVSMRDIMRFYDMYKRAFDL